MSTAALAIGLVVLAFGPAVLALAIVVAVDAARPRSMARPLRFMALGLLTPVAALIPEVIVLAGVGGLVRVTDEPLIGIAGVSIAAGMIEEGVKFRFLRRFAMRRGRIRRPYDAIVIAVAISAGFAALENLGYFAGFASAESAALLAFIVVARTLLSMPMHLLTAVMMGYYAGLARQSWDLDEAKGLRRRAYLIPTAAHSLFDLFVFGIAAYSESTPGAALLAGLALVALEIVMWVAGVRMIVRARWMPGRLPQAIPLAPAPLPFGWTAPQPSLPSVPLLSPGGAPEPPSPADASWAPGWRP